MMLCTHTTMLDASPRGQGHSEKWKVANKDGKMDGTMDGTMVYGQDLSFLQECYSSAWIPTPQKRAIIVS